MHDQSVTSALASIDELLSDHKEDLARLSAAKVRRLAQLEDYRSRPATEPVTKARIEALMGAIDTTARVHDAFVAMLGSLLSFSRSQVNRFEFVQPGCNPSIGGQIRYFLQYYALLGYARTASLTRETTQSLCQLYETGASSEAASQLSELAKVAAEVAAEEASKASGIDTAENLVKLAKAIADIRDSMAISKSAFDDVMQWLQRLDESHDRLQEWIKDVAGKFSVIQAEIMRHLAP